MKSFEGSPTRVSDEEEVTSASTEAAAPVEAAAPAAPEMIRVTDEEEPAAAKVENYETGNQAKEYSGAELAEIHNAIPEVQEQSKDEKLADLKADLVGGQDPAVDEKLAALDMKAADQAVIDKYRDFKQLTEQHAARQDAGGFGYEKMSDERLQQGIAETEQQVSSAGHKLGTMFGRAMNWVTRAQPVYRDRVAESVGNMQRELERRGAWKQEGDKLAADLEASAQELGTVDMAQKARNEEGGYSDTALANLTRSSAAAEAAQIRSSQEAIQ